MASLDIKLRKVNKIYHEGEKLSGTIAVDSHGEVVHNGITLVIEGTVNMQLSAKSVGLFEAFYNSVKPINLVSNTIEIAKPGKLPSGHTEIPFEVNLKPLKNRKLFETYHGVFINVQNTCHTKSLSIHRAPLPFVSKLKFSSFHKTKCIKKYLLKCDMKRSLLNKDLQKSCEFIIEQQLQDAVEVGKKVMFTISPESINTTKKTSKVPNFSIEGHLETALCDIRKPFHGEFVVAHSEIPIKSIELQLVRIETCGCAEGYAKDGTEIQNLQIAEGDICKGISIPIYMIFPRLFTCPTTETPNFKIEFEVNIVIVFQNDHLVTENFPIKLYR